MHSPIIIHTLLCGSTRKEPPPAAWVTTAINFGLTAQNICVLLFFDTRIDSKNWSFLNGCPNTFRSLLSLTNLPAILLWFYNLYTRNLSSDSLSWPLPHWLYANKWALYSHWKCVQKKIITGSSLVFKTTFHFLFRDATLSKLWQQRKNTEVVCTFVRFVRVT